MTNPTTGLKVTSPGDLDIVMEREFNAPRALVFEAWTSCEQLKRWWGPPTWSLPECEIDLRVGGRWRYLMRGEGGEEMGMNGEYMEVAGPGRLVSTETSTAKCSSRWAAAPSTPWSSRSATAGQR
jgi:uncharacterized protein YndB with AHSA1/START domain